MIQFSEQQLLYKPPYYKNPNLPSKQGIYLLLYRSKVLYVRRTNNIQIRAASHCPNKFFKKEMKISFLEIQDRAKLKEAERFFIKALKPEMNGRWYKGGYFWKLHGFC